jgi:hypothetical protein
VITRAVGVPSTLALTTEGLEVAEVVMRDYTNYGRIFTEQWQSGHGFLLVEEDVVPWPGAMAQLDRCQEDWCCFEFPNGVIHEEPRSGFCDGLGCMKFSTDLVRRYEFSPLWQQRGWDELDGAVHALHREGGEKLHLQTPPVAHAKAQVLVSRRGEIPRSGVLLVEAVA